MLRLLDHLGTRPDVDPARIGVIGNSKGGTEAYLAAAADESTRSYVERLESMVDEARLPAGDELISEIERFLRQQGSQGGELPN